MALKVHFASGPREGEVLDFEDDRSEVLFGRDPERCDVVFPESETQVSREHCGLKRVLGRYRLVLNGEVPVYVNGRAGEVDEVLEPVAELQLGKNGPRVVVETTAASHLASTVTLGSPRPAGVRTTRRRLRRNVLANRLLALVAVLLVAAASWIAYRNFKRQTTSLEDVEKRLESTHLQVTTLSQEERRAVASLNRRITDEDTNQRFQELVARAEPSIYLVMLRDPDGTCRPGGTAWVVKKGVLATNAHVALRFETLGAGEKLIARSPARKPRDFEVTRVELHPGFLRFNQILANYQPIDPATGHPSEFIGVCDVALMHVADGAELGAPLALATPQRLLELRSGQVVAFVGYPVEGVVVSTAHPQPVFQSGHITALTDVFHARTVPARQYLVRHNLPLTGGVSGSPLFNRQGEVVALVSAGSFHFFRNPLTGRVRRIPAAVGVNFAQRVDLLRELLDGTARGKQTARSRAWEAELTGFKSGRRSLADIVAELQELFEAQIRVAYDVEAKAIEKVEEERGEIRRAGLDAGVTFEIQPPASGCYLITAVADDVKDINMALFRGKKVVAEDKMRDHYPSVSEQLRQGEKLKILVYSDQKMLPETKFTLLIFHAVE